MTYWLLTQLNNDRFRDIAVPVIEILPALREHVFRETAHVHMEISPKADYNSAAAKLTFVHLILCKLILIGLLCLDRKDLLRFRRGFGDLCAV